MTAWISWKWTGPEEYYSAIWSDADRLPNGNRMGTFGTPEHVLENTSGAVIVEVNEEGEVVREYIFQRGWGIYRVQQIAEQYFPQKPSIGDFGYRFAENNVKMIYPSTSSEKPLDCGGALVSDWQASAYIFTKLKDVTEGLDTDENFIIQESGKPAADSGESVISFGGPYVNPLVKYSESDSTIEGDKAPIKLKVVNDTFQFHHIVDGLQAELPYSDVLNGDKDLFVIEVFRDIRGRFIMLCYGLGWKGTLAAGKFFDTVIYPNLEAYPMSWIIVKWEDTNSNGFVNTIKDGDTYTILASGNRMSGDSTELFK
jgi:hypothetical protein